MQKGEQAMTDIANPMLLDSYLKQLRLPGFLHHWRSFAVDAANSNLSYDRFLLALAEQEVARREQNGREQRIKSAHFPVIKELADFDFTAIPKLNRSKVLQLAECGYIPKAESVIMIGVPGVGKTQPRKCISRIDSFYWRVCNYHRSTASAVWTNLVFSSYH
jgi:DNA replication protein DnaC